MQSASNNPGENYDKQHSVLVVEDDFYFRNALVSAIEETTDLILTGAASDLPEGLRLLQLHKPEVLLVDIGLPSGSGIELIKYASEHIPHCEPMVITVFADDQLVIKCIEAGATGYLLKDSSNLDVAQQIRLLLKGGSPISPAIARRLLQRIGPQHTTSISPDKNPIPSLEKKPTVTLSDQEQSVLSLCSRGYSYREIAAIIDVTSNTVDTYVKRIYRKLQVHSKAEALYEARKLGLVRD